MYHGSPHELEGELLIPNQARDSSSLPENNLFGVYATQIMEIAIATAIVKCDGIEQVVSLFSRLPPYVIILEGEPIQGHIYLHILPNETFENANGTQWISQVPVKPIQTKRLLVQDFIPKIVRYANDIEKEFWYVRNKNPSI